MARFLEKIHAWFQRNERHLSTPAFILGFISDLFTVGQLSLHGAVYLFGADLLIAAVATTLHELPAFQRSDASGVRLLRVVLSLIAQFVTGGLLSGCLIFYTKNAAIVASWPFVLLLAAVFIGNELFRHHRERLAFRCILFFFTLYAYTIFALPEFTHMLGLQTFLESTAITIGIFVLFLISLGVVSWRRFKGSLLEIGVWVTAIILALNASYFTGIIPPLPLALRDADVYHSITHVSGGYAVQEESYTRPWWDTLRLTPITVHIVAGEPLSVYSAVFAPGAFSAGEVHRWQRYDSVSHQWHTVAVIGFPISGGRDGGYRGYSTLTQVDPGEYRVSIETQSGQVIGRVIFIVQQVTQEPQLQAAVL